MIQPRCLRSMQWCRTARSAYTYMSCMTWLGSRHLQPVSTAASRSRGCHTDRLCQVQIGASVPLSNEVLAPPPPSSAQEAPFAPSSITATAAPAGTCRNSGEHTYVHGIKCWELESSALQGCDVTLLMLHMLMMLTEASAKFVFLPAGLITKMIRKGSRLLSNLSTTSASMGRCAAQTALSVGMAPFQLPMACCSPTS